MKPTTAALAALALISAQVAWPQAFTTSLNPSVTQADLAAAAATNLNIMAATTPQFVGGSSAYQTKEALAANYPCSAANLGKVANVSNAFGSYAKRETCLTDTNSGLYYWYPDTPDSSGSVAIASGTYTASSDGTPSTVYFSTTPTGTINIQMSLPCVPGDVKHFYSPASLGLGALSLGGLIGGGTVPLAQGADKIVTCINGTGWKSN